MNSLRYLNTVLTVIAILLATGLWTWWTSPGAQWPIQTATPVLASGIPNAGHQRQEIVNELKRVSQEVQSLANLFRSGQARVRMEAGSHAGER